MIPYTETLIYQTIFGTQVSDEFLEKTQGLKDFIEDVKREAEDGFITGINGQLLPVRSPHSSPNLLLQNGGAVFMKEYLVTIDKDFNDAGLVYNDDYMYVANIHDAVNIEAKPEAVDTILPILTKGFEKASINLGMKYYVKGAPSGQNQWTQTNGILWYNSIYRFVVYSSECTIELMLDADVPNSSQ